MSSSTLRAGSARADITPAMGIQLAGDIGRVRPTEEIRERLYAGALALESGDTRLCLVSLDLLGISTEWANEIRARAARRFGLDPARVILHVVPHHAPHDIFRKSPGENLFPAPDPKRSSRKASQIDFSRTVKNPERALAVQKGAAHRQGTGSQAPDIAGIVAVYGATPRLGIPSPHARRPHGASQNQPPFGVLRETVHRHVRHPRRPISG